MVRPVQPEKKITKVAAVHKIEREKDRKNIKLDLVIFFPKLLLPTLNCWELENRKMREKTEALYNPICFKHWMIKEAKES